MNKIVLNGGTAYLDKYNTDAEIIIKKDTRLDVINLHKDLKLSIIIEKDATLVFNMFDIIDSLSNNIEVTCDDNSKFIFNNSFIVNENYDLTINTNLFGSNIYNEVNIRGINEVNGNIRVIMNGCVAGETKDNVLNEYAKVINKSVNSAVLIPNLIVNTNEVNANHGVSIGKINEEELFYLMSKGLNKEMSTKLIEEGFILSIMSEDNLDHIKNILLGR